MVQFRKEERKTAGKGKTFFSGIGKGGKHKNFGDR